MSPDASPSPSVRPTVEPSASPSRVPSPSPSTKPTGSPIPSPSPTPKLSEEVSTALPKVECALDVILAGGSFSKSGESFWGIMARYAAQGGYPKEDGYVVLTPKQMEACAESVFADLTDLPECPEDSSIVIYEQADEKAGTPERYRLLIGKVSDMKLYVEAYDGVDTLSIRVRKDNNAYDYEVKLSGSAIISIKEK